MLYFNIVAVAILTPFGIFAHSRLNSSHSDNRDEDRADFRAFTMESDQVINHTTNEQTINGSQDNPDTNSIQALHDKSYYFTSILFEKYGDGTHLSLDGYARILCSIGLIPFPNNADDTIPLMPKMPDEGLHPFNCSSITYAQLEIVFGKMIYRVQRSDPSVPDYDANTKRLVGISSRTRRKNNLRIDDFITSDFDNFQTNDRRQNNIYHVDDGQNRGHRSILESKSSNSNESEVNEGQHMETIAEYFQNFTQARQCQNPISLLTHFGIERNFSKNDFIYLCPAIAYQLVGGFCLNKSHHDDMTENVQSTDSILPMETSFVRRPTMKVWIASIVAVSVTSIAGLLCVAVVPFMQRVFYNHLLQFLVAMAVGALSGDALLHLLPHALAKRQHHSKPEHGSLDYNAPQHHISPAHDRLQHDGDRDDVLVGLTALACIFFFFLAERLLTIVTERKHQLSGSREKTHCRRLCNVEASGAVGTKLSGWASTEFSNCEQIVMVVHPNRALMGFADASHDELMHRCDLVHDHQDRCDESATDEKETDRVSCHGHSHSHRHSVPSTVAWMVILGDGIHNLSDGLAIGAAFAGSMSGGIGTTVAVMCHELPHEIGDFAVLMRAGMAVKQAVIYNCISSLLCLMGMVAGIVVGNIGTTSRWIFAGVAGMFLYISLVDMLPEMTSVGTRRGENRFLHLMLQVCGMLLGSGIMLTIAIFEHDLHHLLP